ncbi:transcription factor E2F3 [Melanotaenia boesemani]|uniref:transcription factor E2F3 n=1 Tax=Melanotaenia boesemani TaxID=1250792 RepID=UPI001C0484AE|nr:transcription factor E2F3 [Melanotaenia boesemani]
MARTQLCRSKNTKLELEGSALQDPQDDGGAKQSDETKEAKAFQTQENTRIQNFFLERTRCDTSLGLLTLRFKELLSSTTDGVLDLNAVSRELGVSKRRVYDVTNVLEGIKLIRKKSKNHIQWLGWETSDLLNKDLKDLTEEESKLDGLIQSCARQIRQLCEDRHCRRYAYLTYEDISSIPSLKEQTVIVIKAPAETKLEVPHPEESFQVHLTSIHGPIEVYLCCDKPIPMASTASGTKSSNLNPNTCGKDLFFSMPFLSLIQVSSKEDAGNSHGIKSSSNSQSKPSMATVTPTPTFEVQHKFATPPLPLSVVGGQYLLSLASNEGITDLFSANLDQSPMDVPLT